MAASSYALNPSCLSGKIERTNVSNKIASIPTAEYFVIKISDTFKKCKIETLYLDIGANVGTTSLPVAIHNKNIEVHAFEPNPKIFQSLEINKSLNNCDNLILHKVAVGLKKEKLPLFVTSKEKANFGNSSFQKNREIVKNCNV